MNDGKIISLILMVFYIIGSDYRTNWQLMLQ